MISSEYSNIASVTTLSAPQNNWVKRIGGIGADIGRSITKDNSGNLLTTLAFQGTVDFDGQILTSVGATDSAIIKYSPTGTLLWVKQLGATGAAGGSFAKTVVDYLDNIYVVGFFEGTINLGVGPLTSTGGYDIFIAKYSSAGVIQWSYKFGTSRRDQGTSIAIDSGNNILITGTFQGTINFGGSNLVSPFSGTDTFIAKFTNAGVHVWSKNFVTNADDNGKAIAVDINNNIFVAGDYAGTINMGGSDLVASSGDIFLGKFTSAGVHIWSKRIGGINNDILTDLTVDNNGNPIIAGYFYNQTDLGGGVITGNVDYKSFVAKYNGNTGAFMWERHSTGDSASRGFSVVVDSSSNVLTTGVFSFHHDFGGGTLTSAGNTDAFVVKYDSNGLFLNNAQFGGTLYDSGNAISVDANDDALVLGYFQGTVNFDGQSLTSAGSYDVFLLKTVI